MTRVDLSEQPFHVFVGDDEYRSETVIAATGANARQLGIETELALQGRGVSYCAVCDAAFFRDRSVIVVGGGDSAMEEATFLTKFATKVTVVHRRDEFRASPIMLDRARENERIEILTPTSTPAGRGRQVMASHCNTSTRARPEPPADGVFVAIGHDPDGAVSRLADHDEAGTWSASPAQWRRTYPAFFAAGDARPRLPASCYRSGLRPYGRTDAERLIPRGRRSAVAERARTQQPTPPVGATGTQLVRPSARHRRSEPWLLRCWCPYSHG